MTEGKKVLMIVYFYPPIGGIGSLRTLKVAKYLPSFGWEPIVLTVSKKTLAVISSDASEGDLPGVTVYRSPNPDVAFRLKRLMRMPLEQHSSQLVVGDDVTAGSRIKAGAAELMTEWGGIPDRMIDWFPFGRRQAFKLCEWFRPAAVYSCSPPETTHLIATAVKKRFGTPWLADMRDPWTNKVHASRGRVPAALDEKLERLTLGGADRIVAVSNGIIDRLGVTVPEVPVVLQRNGFDEEDFDAAAPIEGDKAKLNILFAGKFYYPRRDPRPLLEAMRRLREAGRDISRIQFDYAGTDGDLLLNLAREQGVEASVNSLGLIPYKESIARQKGASALLYIQWEPGGDTQPSGKLLEYMGAERPVLALMPTPGGESDDLVKSTSLGVIARNTDDVTAVLESWLDEFERTGTLTFHGSRETVSAHSSFQMVSNIAAQLDDITGGN